MYIQSQQIAVWIEKSNCVPSMESSNCYCPDYEPYLDDSKFISFDIYLSNNKTITYWTDVESEDFHLIYSRIFTKNDIFIGHNVVQTISVNMNDFGLFDYDDAIPDIYTHIITSEFPKSRHYSKIPYYAQSIQITQTVVSKQNALQTFRNNIKILFVTEYGCFNREYYGNNILFSKIYHKGAKNEWFPFSPIFNVSADNKEIKIDRTQKTSYDLAISFYADSIFGFQVKSLLEYESNILSLGSEEILISYFMLLWLNILQNDIVYSVTTYPEIKNIFTEITSNYFAISVAVIIGIIALKADYNYWTNTHLSMRNICCIAILMHAIIPLFYRQHCAYSTFDTVKPLKMPQNLHHTQQEMDNYDEQQFFERIHQYFDLILMKLPDGDKFTFYAVILISVVCSICIGLAMLFIFIIFPLTKIMKCFNLKKSEGVENDVVAIFEVLLFVSGSFVMYYDDSLIYSFYRFVGFGIFIPQIIINFLLKSSLTPKLPLIVWFYGISIDTIVSITNYWFFEYSMLEWQDIAFWCRDVLILLILYMQSTTTIKTKTD